MTNDLKKQFLEIKQEKDPKIRIEKLKILRKKTIFLMLNKETDSEIKNTTELEKLLDPGSICKN